MENKGLSAVIIGATGLVGSTLLLQLLEDSRYEKVITLSRKRIPNNHPKHENYLADLFDPTTYKEELQGDHLFICTGTTKANTPDSEEYYRIEHDLPVDVAKTARENGINKVIAISALGADPNSRFSYNKGKGEMERDIEKLEFERCYFVQPALISGDRQEKRTFEDLWGKFQKLIDPLLVGSFKKYRTIHPQTIARAMIDVAVNDYKQSRIESDALKEIASIES
ncbi:NAD-dependent epimerase/dehydratase family protein [Nonlabens antarcticus]|uniref:NAD-dependent epimerase/dehydratase family protein n=1 Tax=Nonlabens antarcticus TaxID=392714 RepID=UPI001891ECEE|nr:NAD-dependent epimerase/dehydratase family protein [Nonlabens antarcticus]